MQITTPNHVHVKDMLQVLYCYQMNLTEDFITIFNQVDQGPSGVLNNTQLLELTDRLCQLPDAQENSNAGTVMLEARDKLLFAVNHMPRATFSESVDIFGGLINARW